MINKNHPQQGGHGQANRANHATKVWVFKRLKEHHFWIWFWFTLFIDLIILGALAYGFWFMLHLVLTTPSCQFQGNCP